MILFFLTESYGYSCSCLITFHLFQNQLHQMTIHKKKNAGYGITQIQYAVSLQALLQKYAQISKHLYQNSTVIFLTNLGHQLPLLAFAKYQRLITNMTFLSTIILFDGEETILVVGIVLKTYFWVMLATYS